MHSDIILKQGSTHPVCQDYIKKFYYGIVLSDGCSSSKDTDIGARILPQVYISIKDIYKEDLEAKYIAMEAKRIACKELNFDPECLDATLIAMEIKNNRIAFKIWGDGFIFYKAENYPLYVIKFDSQNHPFYLNYFNNNLVKEYEELEVEITAQYSFNEEEEGPKITLADKSKRSDPFTYNLELDTYKVEFAGIASDGLSSFINDKGEYPFKNPWDCINQLTSFKTTAGKFLQRRFEKALKTWNKEFITHYDDISMGVMYFNEHPEDEFY